MEKAIANSSTEYQRLFHEFAHITSVEEKDGYTVYQSDSGQIVSFGDAEGIQAGIGDYLVTDDFSISYRYDSGFLHFGIVYRGITYSVVNGKLVVHSIPSSFVTLEKMNHGVGVWRAGQRFKGVEFSINDEYLKQRIFPLLGIKETDFDFLKVNHRYNNLPSEMTDTLTKIEGYLRNRYLTRELLQTCALELVALMVHPANKEFFASELSPAGRKIMVGTREICLSDADVLKIRKVHEIITDSANAFKTIPVLANEVQISEQKLKYGFQEVYKQTVWDYQNNVRMSKAVWLIQEEKESFDDISKAVGYHSQSAFYNAFKKWCGVTPGQFKKYLLQRHES